MNQQVIENCIWNADITLESVDGEMADLRDLAVIWMRQAPRLVSEIKDALRRRDLPSVHISAHTLKGSLQILCAEELGSAALELERAALFGSIPDEKELLARLESQLNSLSLQISQFLNESSVAN